SVSKQGEAGSRAVESATTPKGKKKKKKTVQTPAKAPVAAQPCPSTSPKEDAGWTEVRRGKGGRKGKGAVSGPSRPAKKKTPAKEPKTMKKPK
ncbi:hypothetical protein, partial [Proteus faecis]|uniref:hypothetical protein n=1 Tax=Proteus faecis TaxID=2050967 RepID=UPI003075D8AC